MDLPPELQCEIFEIAVRSNRKNAALKLSLSLVAQHVHFWIDRVFYQSVTIRSRSNADKFLKLVDLKPPGFFATTVKTLLFTTHPSELQRISILSACTGVQSLAVWNTILRSETLLQISQLSLRRLCISIKYVPAILAASTRSRITHLDLAFQLETPEYLVGDLRQLPCLTHVAMDIDASPSIAKAVCESCPNLQVLLILDYKPPAAAAIDSYSFDSRIVVEESPSDLVEDWEAAPYGFPDMWTHAERVVADRKAAAMSTGQVK
ncbi:hypothetical protein MVEN_01489900 [Mycena venus]|uniref:F-box domain-containing protein n=1 Tax=Mycena venus TaxID=2733690 RepID=A0A8H6XUB6_9AGAR|nr:hypothetical protein MVEN_01489900 [Mycena venus]